jgi:hypothetical protein
MSKVLIDWSGLALANVLGQQALLKGASSEKITSICRHTILNTILSYKRKYGNKYGEIIIACDGRNYWRKEFFPQYKYKRKKDREESGFDWASLFEAVEQIKSEIVELFPYKVIQINEAEADDIFSVICKYSQTHNITDNFFESEPEPILLMTSDNDMIQLQKYSNVSQYSPLKKKLINVSKKEIDAKILEHIVKGDSGDGVPNILSKDDVFVTGTRQTPVSAKRLSEFHELGFTACRNDEERRNWQRNEMLVSLDKIPEWLENKIIEQYELPNPTKDLNKIMNYLIKNRCSMLLSELENF